MAARVPVFAVLAGIHVQTPQAGSQTTAGEAFEVQWTIDAPEGAELDVLLWAYNPDLVGSTDVDPNGDGWLLIAAGGTTPGQDSFAWDTTGLPSGWYILSAWTGYEDVWVITFSAYWLEIV